MNPITPNLWYDTQAEEAAEFYVKIFQGAPGADPAKSKIKTTTHYPTSTEKVSGKPAGSIMTVSFDLNGQEFLALNGGPNFKFNESVSFIINCDNQEQIDYYWEKLSAVPESEICGWCKDKFGVSWQVSPKGFDEMSKDPKFDQYMAAILTMKKIIIKDLEDAVQG